MVSVSPKNIAAMDSIDIVRFVPQRVIGKKLAHRFESV